MNDILHNMKDITMWFTTAVHRVYNKKSKCWENRIFGYYHTETKEKSLDLIKKECIDNVFFVNTIDELEFQENDEFPETYVKYIHVEWTEREYSHGMGII